MNKKVQLSFISFLTVIKINITTNKSDFVFIKEKTGATYGNLSVSLEKLSEAGYITINKFIDGKRPRTVCKITPKGIDAFEKYVKALQDYIKK